jgi:hypothetical protein
MTRGFPLYRTVSHQEVIHMRFCHVIRQSAFTSVQQSISDSGIKSVNGRHASQICPFLRLGFEISVRCFKTTRAFFTYWPAFIIYFQIGVCYAITEWWLTYTTSPVGHRFEAEKNHDVIGRTVFRHSSHFFAIFIFSPRKVSSDLLRKLIAINVEFRVRLKATCFPLWRLQVWDIFRTCKNADDRHQSLSWFWF